MKVKHLMALEVIAASNEQQDDRATLLARLGDVFSDATQDELIESILYLSERFVNAFSAAHEQFEFLAITEFGINPYEAEKLNLPTLGGALLGNRLPEVDESKVCASCAFRKGTPANQSFSTTYDATECLQGERVFWCHEKTDAYGEPIEKCRGFLQANACSKSNDAMSELNAAWAQAQEQVPA
jgi:hypothetical protein